MGRQEIVCACGCGRSKLVRVADIKRGWGKFYSKSCKAKAQAKRRGGKPEMSKDKRFQRLVWAHEDGRISDEYYYRVLQDEYPEFMTAEDDYQSYIHNDVHPFSSEGLGQD